MTDYATDFPTYLEWLAAHPDDVLRDYFARVVTTIGNNPLPTLSQELPIHSELAFDTLLTHATSTQLAILHAASELEATRSPATVAEFSDVLSELFDIAGTPCEEIPTTGDLAEAAAGLIHMGLLYSPTVDLSHPLDQLANAWQPSTLFSIAPVVPGAFHPDTSHLWRLVDAHRNLLPESELVELFDKQSDRQRSILRMLHANGGVGHSAAFKPGANPDHPLVQLLENGLLDRLDDTTVRVTGRLREILNGVTPAPPGGVWTRPTVEISAATKPDAAGLSASTVFASTAARAVQLISDLSDTLEELAEHPITPLNRGGIGVREIRKIATRRDLTPDVVSTQLTLLLETNLLALGTTTPRYEGSNEPFFGITEAALDFLAADLPTQWAHLITGWLASGYSPWLVNGDDIRMGQREAYSEHAGRLRHHFPALHTALNPTPDLKPSQAQLNLWRLRPALAWQTTTDIWKHLHIEAHQIGLAAALPLSDSDCLVDHLRELLPPPVDILIVQGDHTILAPGPLRADDAHLLSTFATKESSGMASVWRVTTDTLRHAFSRGLDSARILDFLGTMSPTPLPQSLTYMVKDAWDGSESASDKKRATYHVKTPRPSTPHPPDMMEYIHAYRDCLTEQGHRLTHAATDPAAIAELLRTAAESRQQVEVTLADASGHPTTICGHLIAVNPTLFSIIDADSGTPTSVHPHRLISATTRVE